NSLVAGAFKVRGQIDAAGAGASAYVDVTIPVTGYTSTTTASSAPNPSDSNAPVTGSFSVASNGGPVPTGTVDVTIAGSAETCSGTLTAGSGSCQFTLADHGVNRVITATYNGDALSIFSSGTTLQTVKNCPLTLVVTNTNDSGPGSLRQALVEACATDVVTFAITAPSSGLQTIQVDSPLVFDKNIT